MRAAAVTAALLLLVSACGEEFQFEGTPGQPTPITLRAWVPVVQMQVGDDARQRPALMDTGSPIVTLSSRAFPGLSPGEHQVSLSLFGLRFPDFTSYSLDLFGGQSTCGGAPVGLVGGDLMRHFRLGLDYRGRQAFLFHGEGDDATVASGTAAAEAVAVEVLGGGVGELVKKGSGIFVEVGATRVVVAPALVEGKQVNVMVDTGASLTVVEGSLLKALGATDRPMLCCETVAVVDGVVQMPVSRLRSLRLGSVTVSNLPVLVVEQSSSKQALFSNLSAEVGKKIQLLVGGTFLRHFGVKLDYDGGTLSLARYKQQDHVEADEYVGPGFSFCASDKGEHVVVGVYQGTDAAARGVTAGEVLREVDGKSVAGMTEDQVSALLRKPGAGSTVKLTFGKPADTVERTVKVERLLKDYK